MKANTHTNKQKRITPGRPRHFKETSGVYHITNQEIFSQQILDLPSFKMDIRLKTVNTLTA